MGDHGRELNSAPYGHPGRPLPASAPLRPCSAGELAPTPLTSGREVRCCRVHPCWGRRPRSARAGGKRCPRGARRPPPPVVAAGLSEHLGVPEACTPPGISPPITSTSSQATGYGNRVPASRPPHGPHDGTLPVLAPFSPPDTKTTFSWLRYDLEQFGKWHLCKQN